MTDDRGDDLKAIANEVANSIHARRELGEHSEDGVIANFLERTGDAIDARVDARMTRPDAPKPTRPIDGGALGLALGSIGLGIPLTAIATAFGDTKLIVALVIWIAIASINVAYNRRR